MRVRLLQTHYPHWGKYAGYHQFIRYLDEGRVRAKLYRHADGYSTFRWPVGGLRKLAQRNAGPVERRWYSITDFAAELQSIPSSVFGSSSIVHFLDGEHSANYLPIWLRRLPWQSARTIATYHQPAHMLDALVEPATIRCLDRVNVVSRTQAAYFEQFIEDDKVSVILHGVDTDYFSPAAGGPGDGVFRILTVGHWLRDWAAIDAVIERLGRDKSMEFHFVGRKNAPAHGPTNVFHHHNVTDAGLRSLYQQADILFLPLTDSTANNSLLEGIACGLPVVSTKMASVEEYLPGNEAILVEKDRHDDLAAAVLALRDDEDTRRSMGRQARGRAEELGWHRVAPQFEALYALLD
jgi:glycosyltransferase involved in cell wall biosynthesis